MKKQNLLLALPTLPTILFILSAFTGSGQNNDSTRAKIKAMGTVMVDKTPQYPGGDEARIKFLSDNIKYPEEAKKLGIQGKVFMTILIKADGTVANVKVHHGIGGGCDEEAIRIIKMMPKWSPAILNGKPVDYQLTFPIKFILPTDAAKNPDKVIGH